MDVDERKAWMRGPPMPAPLDEDADNMLLLLYPPPPPPVDFEALFDSFVGEDGKPWSPSEEGFRELFGEPWWPSKELLRQMLVDIAPPGSIPQSSLLLSDGSIPPAA